MTTTIVYYNENEYGYSNSKVFHVLTPMERKIFIETFNEGRVTIGCSSGTIDEYAQIIVGCLKKNQTLLKCFKEVQKE